MQRIATVAILAFTVFLVACNGGGGGSTPAPIATVPANPGGPGGHPGPTPSPSPSAASGPLVYIANSYTSIVGFPINTGGNIQPAKTISGPQTQLYGVNYLAFDANGNLYATNSVPPFSPGTLNIVVFAPGSSGNVAPARMIEGPNTGFGGAQILQQMGFDSAGNLYVAEDIRNSTGIFAEVSIFPPNANGNVTPLRTIIAPCAYPTGLAVTPAGEVSIVCQPGDPQNPSPPEIVTFAAGATGSATPSRIIAGPNTQLNADNEMWLYNGILYVAANGPNNTPAAILGFPQNANGDVAPTVVIRGSSTQLSNDTVGVTGINATGQLYASNGGTSQSSQWSITEYASGANGNVAPINVITGPNTTLPTGFGPPMPIAVGPP